LRDFSRKFREKNEPESRKLKKTLYSYSKCTVKEIGHNTDRASGRKKVKLTDEEFIKQLRQYIEFRGIDIILHLKDGTRIELDKNRMMEGDVVIQKNMRAGMRGSIHLKEIAKADFYAA
jgi:hypothetical protein